MQAAGINDREREQDIFATGTWVHTYSPGLMLIVSPFYHFNRAAYEGGPNDVPIATDNRASNYEGGQVTLSWLNTRNNARAGVYAFAQQDNTFFSVVANDGSGDQFSQRVYPGGYLFAAFLEDQFKATSWLTFTGGLRLTHFSGNLTENAVDPRLGVAITVPKLNWVLRAAYSYFYQPPPLDTVSGSLLDFTQNQGLGFLPLQGERDIQQEYGITIPLRNWASSLTYFHTSARNFFDHDAIGNSNIFLPLTIQGAIIEGEEATLRSPLILHRYHAHLVYSHQIRRRRRRGHRRAHGLLSARRRGVLSRPRPAQHALSGLRWKPAVAQLRRRDHQLWLGLSQRRWPQPSAGLLHASICRWESRSARTGWCASSAPTSPTRAISWTTAIPSAAPIGPIPSCARCR